MEKKFPGLSLPTRLSREVDRLSGLHLSPRAPHRFTFTRTDRRTTTLPRDLPRHFSYHSRDL